MPTAFSIEHDGRRIEVVPESTLTKDRLRLLIDGQVVAEAKRSRTAPIEPPSLEPPDWLAAILASKAIWLPLILGLVIALREWRRRHPAGRHPQRGGTDAEGGAPPRPDQQPGQGPVS